MQLRGIFKDILFAKSHYLEREKILARLFVHVLFALFLGGSSATSLADTLTAQQVEANRLVAECYVRAEITVGIVQRHDRWQDITKTRAEFAAFLNAPVGASKLPVKLDIATKWVNSVINNVYNTPRNPAPTFYSNLKEQLAESCANNAELYIKPSIIDWKKYQAQQEREEKRKKDTQAMRSKVSIDEIQALITKYDELDQACAAESKPNNNPIDADNWKNIKSCVESTDIFNKLQSLGLGYTNADSTTYYWYDPVTGQKFGFHPIPR